MNNESVFSLMLGVLNVRKHDRTDWGKSWPLICDAFDLDAKDLDAHPDMVERIDDLCETIQQAFGQVYMYSAITMRKNGASNSLTQSMEKSSAEFHRIHDIPMDPEVLKTELESMYDKKLEEATSYCYQKRVHDRMGEFITKRMEDGTIGSEDGLSMIQASDFEDELRTIFEEPEVDVDSLINPKDET